MPPTPALYKVSIGLAIAAAVVYQQIDFVRHLDLGFRRDNIVITSANRLSPQGMKAFADALARGPGIVGVTRSSMTAFQGAESGLIVQKPGDPQMFTPTHYAVTPDYFQQDLERYLRVTPADVQRVARQYLASAHRVVLSVVPQGRTTLAVTEGVVP